MCADSLVPRQCCDHRVLWVNPVTARWREQQGVEPGWRSTSWGYLCRVDFASNPLFTTARLPLSEWYNHPSSCLARTSKARCRWTEASGTYTRMNLPFSHLRCLAAVAEGRCNFQDFLLILGCGVRWYLKVGSRTKLCLVRS